jgi:hypothetical protein
MIKYFPSSQGMRGSRANNLETDSNNIRYKKTLITKLVFVAVLVFENIQRNDIIDTRKKNGINSCGITAKSNPKATCINISFCGAKIILFSIEFKNLFYK